MAQFPFASPGIQVREFDQTFVAQPTAISTGAFAGVFNSGPVNQRVLINSEADLVNVFGPPSDANRESFYTCANFLAYADRLYVVRVSNAPLSSYATPSVELDTVTVASQSGVFSNSDVINVTTGGTETTAANVGITTDAEGKITAVTLVSRGVFDSADYPTPVGGQTAVTANNLSNTASLLVNVTTRPIATANQEAISIYKSNDDAEWRAKVGDDGFGADANVLFVARQTGNTQNIRVSVCDSPNAYSFDMASAFDAATANVEFKTGLSYVDIQTASSSAAVTLSDKLVIGNLLRVSQGSPNSATGAAETVSTLKVVGKRVVGANVSIAFDQKWTYANTGSIEAANSSTWSRVTPAGGNTVTDARTVRITRLWEFADVFPPITSTQEADLLRGSDYIKDMIHIAVVDDSTSSLRNVYQSLSRAKTITAVNNQTGLPYQVRNPRYYVDAITRDSNSLVWWANHRSGLNIASAKDLVDQGDTLPYTSRLGRGSEAATEDSVSLSTIFNGYDLFADPAEVDIGLVLAGKARGGDNGEAIINYIVDNLCEKRRDCMVVGSPQKADVTRDTNTLPIVDKVIQFRNSVRSSSYCILDSGYKTLEGRYGEGQIDVPLNGDIAGLIARTEVDRDAWFSPAGFNRGKIKNITRLFYNPNQGDRDELYPNEINPVVTFPNTGTILFGDKTTLGAGSAFDRINVRRLFIVLQKTIAQASRNFLFEFNDEFTRAQFVGLVDPFLRAVKGRRGIIDYRIVCDSTNNTPEVIDNNGFVGDIFIKPARSINYIQLNFVALRTDVNISEAVVA